MGKSFRLLLWRIFPSFRSCRSREPTAVAAVSPVYRLPLVRSDSSDADLRRRRPRPISFRFCRPARWRGMIPPSPRRKVDSDYGGALLSAAPRRREAACRRRGRGRGRRREPMRRVWENDSSAGEDSGWFSSEEENEWASEGFNHYYYHRRTGISEQAEEDERKMLISSTDMDSYDDCAVKWVERRSIGWEAEAAVAVVKRSEDPREDFRLSMAEMVVEKEIFDAVGLQQLLRCFLSLNSLHHHAAIVAAFEDIWAALFPKSAVPGAGFSEMGYNYKKKRTTGEFN